MVCVCTGCKCRDPDFVGGKCCDIGIARKSHDAMQDAERARSAGEVPSTQTMHNGANDFFEIPQSLMEWEALSILRKIRTTQPECNHFKASNGIVMSVTGQQCRAAERPVIEHCHSSRRDATRTGCNRSTVTTSTRSLSTGASIDTHSRPTTSNGIASRKPSLQHQCRRQKELTAAIDAHTIDDVTEEQARWFVNLPDKIRKQQFSRKEQISIAVRCKRVLHNEFPDVADDILRRCLYVGREADTRRSRNRRRKDSVATTDTDILVNEDLKGYESDLLDGLEALAPEMQKYNLCSWPLASVPIPTMAIPPPIESSISMASMLPVPIRSKSMASLRTPISSSVNLSDSNLRARPSMSSLPLSQHSIPRSRTFSISAATSPNKLESGELARIADFRQHRPPNVRQQLREYLSPRKFDEAIAFGFAFSDDDRHRSSRAYGQPHAHQHPLPDLVDDNDLGDDDSYDPTDSLDPPTPTYQATAVTPSVFKQPSLDSSVRSQPKLFSSFRFGKARKRSDSVSGREMTIHMTLTRRELQESNEAASHVQRPTASGVDVERIDPLSLDPLYVCEDPTGAHGAFAVRNSKGLDGFKRIWRSVTRRY